MSTRTEAVKREIVRVDKVTVYVCDLCGKETTPGDGLPVGWFAFSGLLQENEKMLKTQEAHLSPECARKVFPYLFGETRPDALDLISKEVK